MPPAVKIRKNDDGKIDEIVAEDCFLHIEQMTDDGWFIDITGKDGSHWQFWVHTETYARET